MPSLAVSSFHMQVSETRQSSAEHAVLSYAASAHKTSYVQIYALDLILGLLGLRANDEWKDVSRGVCILYGSRNKQQLLPYKTLRDWFL
jgi:hypothetical protein